MKKVAIIGGGLSGIAAAIKLIDNNSHNKLEVTLFEAKSNLGGRINSFKDAKSGDVIDNGQHIAIGAYKNFFELLNKLDTFDHLKPQTTLHIDYLVNNQYYKLKASENKITKLLDLDLAIGLINFKLLNYQDKIQIIKFALNLKFRFSYLSKIIQNKKLFNVFDFLNVKIGSIHQTQNSIKYFWEPLCIATLNTPIEIASITVFLEVLKQGFFAGSELSKIYFSEIGLAELLKPIENYNNSNLIIKLNNIITKVEYTETINKVQIYTKDNEVLEFDYVISALNYDVFLKLFESYTSNGTSNSTENSTTNNINNFNLIKSSPILSIYLWFDIDFIKYPIVSLPESLLQWVFNKRLIDKQKPKDNYSEGFYCVTISAADNIKMDGKTTNLMEFSNNEIIELVLNELKIHLPKEDGSLKINFDFKSHLLHYRVIKENKATFVCSEDIHNIRPQNLKINDWLFVAGDWVKNDFPSTIEGAVINGNKAAEELLRSI